MERFSSRRFNICRLVWFIRIHAHTHIHSCTERHTQREREREREQRPLGKPQSDITSMTFVLDTYLIMFPSLFSKALMSVAVSQSLHRSASFINHCLQVIWCSVNDRRELRECTRDSIFEHSMTSTAVLKVISDSVNRAKNNGYFHPFCRTCHFSSPRRLEIRARRASGPITFHSAIINLF